LFAKNLYRPVFAPDMSDRQVAILARVMVLVITAIALYFSIHSSPTLVALLLLGYAGITQFFPGVVLGLFTERVTTASIFAGMATGVATVAVLMLSKHDPIYGLNAGFVALCLNFLIVGVVSLLTPKQASGFEHASAHAS
jgi:SSS family solute:Na+ symporter